MTERRSWFHVSCEAVKGLLVAGVLNGVYVMFVMGVLEMIFPDLKGADPYIPLIYFGIPAMVALPLYLARAELGRQNLIWSESKGLCKRCGYNLRGLEQETICCPECGSTQRNYLTSRTNSAHFSDVNI